MPSSKQDLQAELRRELESIGFDVERADELARKQLQNADDGDEDDDFNPPQHVVPVSRGWVVIRNFANQDMGRFETREEAIAEAHNLAEESGARVIIHDSAGRVEREE